MVCGRRIGASGMVKAARNIPVTVRARQASASNPHSSSFVSANAGSGKTHVLVQRVIRLLLTGVPPEKILCITFTKAAAANMAERVFTTLGHWVTLDDAALDDASRDVGIPDPSLKLRKTARELFARALETPGGLKVQTIHALCTRLLQQFPFEADVPARFAVLDERDQTDMMERANLRVFLEASNAPDSVLGRALLTSMANAADVTSKEVVREACLSRDHFMAWTDQAGSAAAAAEQMCAALGLDPADRIEEVEREMVDGPYLPRSRWREVAAILNTGSKADQTQAARFRQALGLIDAAQDTSPRQWDIVAHIISEFTSGAGARDGVTRTIFAVGDEKQSIFSFQGAAPREFDSRRRGLEKRFRDAGLKFDPVSFTYSFRSGPAILQSVDFVFRDETIYRSIHSAETGYPIHNS